MNCVYLWGLTRVTHLSICLRVSRTGSLVPSKNNSECYWCFVSSEKFFRFTLFIIYLLWGCWGHVLTTVWNGWSSLSHFFKRIVFLCFLIKNKKKFLAPCHANKWEHSCTCSWNWLQLILTWSDHTTVTQGLICTIHYTLQPSNSLHMCRKTVIVHWIIDVISIYSIANYNNLSCWNVT